MEEEERGHFISVASLGPHHKLAAASRQDYHRFITPFLLRSW